MEHEINIKFKENVDINLYEYTGKGFTKQLPWISLLKYKSSYAKEKKKKKVKGLKGKYHLKFPHAIYGYWINPNFLLFQLIILCDIDL